VDLASRALIVMRSSPPHLPQTSQPSSDRSVSGVTDEALLFLQHIGYPPKLGWQKRISCACPAATIIANRTTYPREPPAFDLACGLHSKFGFLLSQPRRGFHAARARFQPSRFRLGNIHEAHMLTLVSSAAVGRFGDNEGDELANRQNPDWKESQHA
jgi:hypothetical protein